MQLWVVSAVSPLPNQRAGLPAHPKVPCISMNLMFKGPSEHSARRLVPHIPNGSTNTLLRTSAPRVRKCGNVMVRECNLGSYRGLPATTNSRLKAEQDVPITVSDTPTACWRGVWEEAQRYASAFAFALFQVSARQHSSAHASSPSIDSQPHHHTDAWTAGWA